jgi:hypothetical protein
MRQFNQKDLQNGIQNQQRSRETPNSFAELNGATSTNNDGDLAKENSRMAGVVGARAMEMMRNPQEKARTANWMQAFSTSNQGMEWNAAKMGLPPQE